LRRVACNTCNILLFLIVQVIMQMCNLDVTQLLRPRCRIPSNRLTAIYAATTDIILLLCLVCFSLKIPQHNLMEIYHFDTWNLTDSWSINDVLLKHIF